MGRGCGSQRSQPGSRRPRCALAAAVPAPPRVPLTCGRFFLAGNYRTQLYDKQREEYQPATPGLGMFVEVKDPEDKVSRALSPAESSALHLAPAQAGAGSSPPSFRICQTAKDSWWCGKIRDFHSRPNVGCCFASCSSQLLPDCRRTPPNLSPSLSHFLAREINGNSPPRWCGGWVTCAGNQRILSTLRL